MGWYSASDLPFEINLVGLGDGETGDVITRDGEILGTWVLDAEDHPGFIPNGQTEIVIWDPFIPIFCDEVAAWQRRQEEKAAEARAMSPGPA